MKRLYIAFAILSVSVSAFAQTCSNIFFSEYVEGSSFNKAVELYNPTSLPINLTGYKILQYNSGASNQVFSFNLFGNIPANGTYVIANSQANATILSKADSASGNQVFSFNGDDPLILVKGNDTIDAIGVWGNNITDTIYLRNKSLVRKNTVQGGNKNWQVGATEWNVNNTDVEDLGNHTANACALPSDTSVQFVGTSVSVNENYGVYNLQVALNQPQHSGTITALVSFVSSAPASASLADIGNFTNTTVTFVPNVSVANVAITITDDATIEGIETFTFGISNVTGSAALGTDVSFNLSIAANDSTVTPPSSIPFYTIDRITSEDADGVADSLNVRCRTSGVVHGINTSKTGLQFIISDHTGWIQVYSIPSKTFGYSITEGDSVLIQGKVDQYFGMTQMSFLDTIIKISGSNGIRTPTAISSLLSENMEASLVRVNNAILQNASQWTNAGSGFTVTAISNSLSYRVRIDSLTSAFGTNAPTGNFDVIGWVSQYDSCNPSCLKFYQLNPRYSSDIIRYNSIDEVANANNTFVYPNPAKDAFHILTNVNASSAKVTLFNIIGSKLYETYHEINNNDIYIKPNLNSGSYFGVIDTDKERKKFRFDIVK